MERSTRDSLLQLIKIAIKRKANNVTVIALSNTKNLFELASVQGVKGLAWEGIELQMNANLLQMNKSEMLKWYGQILYLEKVTRKLYTLSAEYANSILPCRCVVLKGFDYACYWPNPLHREYGDLDYYSGLEFQKSNEVAKQIGAIVKDGGYKHSHIHYKGMAIENHHFFTDFNATKQGCYTESLLKDL